MSNMVTNKDFREYRAPECAFAANCPSLLCDSPDGMTEDFVDQGTFQW